MSPGSEEDETPVEKARYEGEYKDGLKHGIGKMVYPNKDVYEGEWFENKVSRDLSTCSYRSLLNSNCTTVDGRRRNIHVQ